MKTYPHDYLCEVSFRILKAAGANADVGRIVGEHLVEADLCGVGSHGVMRISHYVKSIVGAGDDDVHAILPAAEVVTRRDDGCVAVLDGGWGFGQPAACLAMKMAIEKARRYGIGAVGAVNCGHIGRLAAYSSMAVENDFIGIVVAKTLPVMVPHGGASRILGNNPYSLAAPAGEELPIIVDFATAVAARGKILVKKSLGESLPEGWIVDKEGRASVDPQAFIEGGSLLPFGRHKGYGLSVMGELLAGTLLGTGSLLEYEGHNSVLTIAIKVANFLSAEDFKASVDKLVRTIKGSKVADGFTEILLPGEPEARERKKRLREGIPLDDGVMEQIKWAAAELNVSL